MNTLLLRAQYNDHHANIHGIEDYKAQSQDFKSFAYVRGNRQENLFNNLYELNKHNVKDWFHMLEQYKALGPDGQAAVRWLMVMLPNGCSMVRAIELAPKVTLYHGYEIDYVTHFVNETFHMEHKLGHLVKYFDYAAYAFDLQRERKIDKVIFERQCYTVTNASDFNVWGI